MLLLLLLPPVTFSLGFVSVCQILQHIYLQAVSQTENQKVLLINIMFSFGVGHPDDPFFRFLSRFQKVNKLKKKEHFMARKRVFQIQHACLDSTLFLGHWSVLTNFISAVRLQIGQFEAHASLLLHPLGSGKFPLIRNEANHEGLSRRTDSHCRHTRASMSHQPL